MPWHWLWFSCLYFVSGATCVLSATTRLNVTKAEFLTFFPVMWCRVIRDLNTVGLPGLDPPSTQNTDVSQPPVLLAQERADVAFFPISTPPHISDQVWAQGQKEAFTMQNEQIAIHWSLGKDNMGKEQSRNNPIRNSWQIKKKNKYQHTHCDTICFGKKREEKVFMSGGGRNDYFDFKTSKTNIWFQWWKMQWCAKQCYWTSLAEQQPLVIYQMLNFRNEFSLIM